MDPKWIQINETRWDKGFGTASTIASALEHSKYEGFKRLIGFLHGKQSVS
jgi:hypothetical protein